MHVLSMPPAFVLSQDQTLMLIPANPFMNLHDWIDSNKGRQTLEPKSANVQRHFTPPPAHPFLTQQFQSTIAVPEGTSGLTANSS